MSSSCLTKWYVAGALVVGLLLPVGALAGLGAPGDMYVSNFNHRAHHVPGDDKILEFNPGTGEFVGDFVPYHPELSQPRGLTFGPNGNLFVVSYRIEPEYPDALRAVLEFDGDTGEYLGVFADLSGPSWQGGDINFGPNGNLFVLDAAWAAVREFDGQTGAYLGDFVPQHTALSWVGHMLWTKDGNLYVGNGSPFHANYIAEFDGTTGDFLGHFIDWPYWLDYPADLEYGPDGELYVAMGYWWEVWKYDADTGESLGTFVGGYQAEGVVDMEWGGPDNNLFVTDFDYDKILEFDGQTGAFLGVFADSSSGLNNPSWLTFKPIPEPVVLPLDIKPGSCPNPLNRGSRGLFPVAVLGTMDQDVADIDTSTLVIARSDGVGGSVGPLNSVYEDVDTPFEGEACDCHELGADGIMDLLLKFKTPDVVDALQLNGLNHGDVVELVVTGMLFDGTPLEAYDCIKTVGMNVHEIAPVQSGGAPSGFGNVPAVPR